ncbi:MAG: putative inorganic carbon (HCO3(-)) transporter, partial [Candidatus Omnitrophota bacterium]
MMQGVSLPQQVSYHGARLAIGLAILAPTIALLCSPWPYLAVMPGLLAMGAVVFAVRPQWMFAAILLLIPFGAFRGPLQKILAFGLLLLVVLQAVRDRTFPSEWKSHLWPLLLAFLCVNILSAVLSPYRANSIDNIILLATALLFFALGLRYLAHKDIFHHLPAIIGISVSLSALLAVMGFLFDIRMFLDDSEVFKRGLGGSGSAPSLAGLVIFGMPFLLHGLVSAKTAPVRVGWFIMMLMSLGGLVTTYSRGGALVCGGWLLYTIGKSLLRCPPRRLGLVLSGGAVLLVGVVCVIPPSYWERQVSLANPEDRSLSRRTTYLKIGAEAVAERPILGHGPGAFRKIYGASTWSLHFKGTKQHTLERYA